MRQVLIRNGKAVAEEVPRPQASDGRVLIRVAYSCISAGTELAALAESGKSLLRRALEKRSRVGKLVRSLPGEGVAGVYRKARRQARASTTAAGYSVAGLVAAAGRGTVAFVPGDRVAAAGGGFAHHAEYVDVPVNLVVEVPARLDLADASTVALGATALHGVRRADLRMGELGVVVGAGGLGLLAVQLLRASGVRVAVVDVDLRRLRLAAELGAELCVDPSHSDAVREVDSWSAGSGADAVVFTAATADSDVLSRSFRMCRRKGRVVLVGVSGMALRREDLYAKELDLLMSTSYGPGRYDESYERQGRDYPYAYVRWTERRNMAEYLRLVGSGSVDLRLLKEGIFPVAEAAQAYASLRASPRPVVTLLSYGDSEAAEAASATTASPAVVRTAVASVRGSRVSVGLIGTGSYATGTILPMLRSLGDRYCVRAVAGRTPHRAEQVAEECGAGYATTDPFAVVSDESLDLVVIVTRHDSHASLALAALEAGRNVFVEKPLAIDRDQLERIETFFGGQDSKCLSPLLQVGFNRRFSPYARAAKAHLEKRRSPLFAVYRMNAGYLPADHWVHGPEGGGRIVGEACHVIDLFTYLAGTRVQSVGWESLSAATGRFSPSDNKALVLKYRDGSVCVLSYFALGSREYPKEHLEIHFDERSIVINDYKRLELFGLAGPALTSAAPEKGQRAQWEALHGALTEPGASWPIELWEMIQTTAITLAIT